MRAGLHSVAHVVALSMVKQGKALYGQSAAQIDSLRRVSSLLSWFAACPSHLGGVQARQQRCFKDVYIVQIPYTSFSTHSCASGASSMGRRLRRASSLQVTHPALGYCGIW
jgi:hypothetical protein